MTGDNDQCTTNVGGGRGGDDDNTSCGSNNLVKLDHHQSSLANLNTNSTLGGTV